MAHAVFYLAGLGSIDPVPLLFPAISEGLTGRQCSRCRDRVWYISLCPAKSVAKLEAWLQVKWNLCSLGSWDQVWKQQSRSV